MRNCFINRTQSFTTKARLSGLRSSRDQTKVSGGSGLSVRTAVGLCFGNQCNATLQGRTREDGGETR